MSVIMMSAPSFANARAWDLPWPRAPPVISTTLPSNRPTAPLLLIDGPAWRSPGSRDAVACAFVSTGRHLVSVPRSGGPPLDLLGDRRHEQWPGQPVLLLPPTQNTMVGRDRTSKASTASSAPSALTATMLQPLPS